MDNKNNLVSNQLGFKYPHCFLTFLLSIGTAILYLLMLMCVFTAIGLFFMLHNTKAAIEALIIGFLLGPYGIPMIGAVIIAFIQGINEAIKSI